MNSHNTYPPSLVDSGVRSLFLSVWASKRLYTWSKWLTQSYQRSEIFSRSLIQGGNAPAKVIGSCGGIGLRRMVMPRKDADKVNKGVDRLAEMVRNSYRTTIENTTAVQESSTRLAQ